MPTKLKQDPRFETWIDKNRPEISNMTNEQLYVVLGIVLHALRKSYHLAPTFSARVGTLIMELIRELEVLGI